VLGRRRPLVRSVIWNACLLGLLFLPVAPAALPRLRFSAPHRWADAPVAPKALGVAVGEPSHAIAAAVAAPEPGAPWWSHALAPIVAGYAAAALVLLVRLLRSLQAVTRLRRSSVPVAEGPWTGALERWRRRLGLSRPVRLVQSDGLSVPVAVGWLRPAILLPGTLVDTATPGTIDAVLLHELAHVRRGDYAWNLLLRLVQVIYWPHPLIWLIGRMVAGVREQACDDLCVACLGGPASYIATLLDVSAGLIRRPWEALGLAMARSTKLARRLTWINQSAGSSRCLLRAPARGAIVVAVLVAFGVLGSVTLVRPRADEPPKGDRPPGRRVRVERVALGKVLHTSSQVGSLQAYESAQLFAKVSGYLESQEVDIGDRVKQGQRLAQIHAPEVLKDAEQGSAALDQARVALTQAESRLKTADAETRASQAAVAQAQAELERSRANRKFREQELARFKALRDKNAVPQQILEEGQSHRDAAVAAEQAAVAAVVKSEADVASASSRVEQTKADLLQARGGVRLAAIMREKAEIMAGYTRINSPYTGVITRRSFHPGDFVRAPDAGTNVPLLTVARTDKMRVVTRVPDRDVPYLDRGDPATITLDALPGRTFQGKVARFAESEDPSRTMRTEIDLDNPGNQLREGMYCVVTIVLEAPQATLTIPTSALVREGADGLVSCFRVVDGRAELVPIKVGRDDGNRVAVLEGLKEGDLVAVDPDADHLKPGQTVEVDAR
jgi:RND family efflux transporter MFP subunit